MTLITTAHPLVPAEATDRLKERGFRVFVSTESSLEAGNGTHVLQIIRLEDGEYRASQLPQKTTDVDSHRDATVLPEMGEVLKWLEARSALSADEQAAFDNLEVRALVEQSRATGGRNPRP